MGYTLVAVGLAVGILTVSLGRTSLNIMAKDGRCELDKNNPVMIDRVDADGNTIQDSYKLPTVGMLPTNPLYGFRRIRDFLWLAMSFSAVEHSRMALFIADKKMAEAIALNDTQKIDLAMDFALEAVENLGTAHRDLKKVDKKTNDDALQIARQTKLAGRVYLKIIGSFCGTFDMENSKYGHLLEVANVINNEIQNDPEI